MLIEFLHPPPSKGVKSGVFERMSASPIFFVKQNPKNKMLESSFRWIHTFFKCVFSTIVYPKMPRRRRVKKGKMTKFVGPARRNSSERAGPNFPARRGPAPFNN